MRTLSSTPLPATERGRPAASGPVPGRSRRSAGYRSRLLILLVGGSVIVVVLAAVLLFFGRVAGREFAPTHFQTRSFSYLEIPLLKLQITPIRRITESSPLAAYLQTAGFVQRPQGPPTQWHLIEVHRAGSPTSLADAELLTEFLEHYRFDGTGRADLYWHAWSTDHPALAAVLWPKVQRLAERELYLLIPELFRIADRASAADPLARAIDEYLQAGYAGLIADLRSDGKTELAESLKQEAIADYPDDTRWQQL